MCHILSIVFFVWHPRRCQSLCRVHLSAFEDRISCCIKQKIPCLVFFISHLNKTWVLLFCLLFCCEAKVQMLCHQMKNDMQHYYVIYKDRNNRVAGCLAFYVLMLLSLTTALYCCLFFVAMWCFFCPLVSCWQSKQNFTFLGWAGRSQKSPLGQNISSTEMGHAQCTLQSWAAWSSFQVWVVWDSDQCWVEQQQQLRESFFAMLSRFFNSSPRALRSFVVEISSAAGGIVVVL